MIVLSAFAGALVFPLSDLGRTSPTAVSKEWILTLAVFWVALAVWGLLYSELLRRRLGLSRAKSLFWAAVCQAPLLLCVALVAVVYSSDLANHAYSIGPYRLVYQALSKGYVIAALLTGQSMVLAAYRRQVLVSYLPLAVIAAVALALRVWNLNWALPALFHPDEHHYIGLAFTVFGNRDLNPHYFDNPSLAIYLDYVLILILSPHVQSFHAAGQFLGLAVSDPRGDYLVDIAARAVSAGAGALTVIAVYMAGAELFNRRSGLFAGALLAVTFLHVRDSHYATNDVLATFLLAASFVYSARIYTRGRAADYPLAGLFGGLAVSAKYNMGFFAVAIVAAHIFRLRSNGVAIRSVREHNTLVIAALASIAGFVAGTPYSVLDFPAFGGGFLHQLGFGSSPWPGQEATTPALMSVATLLRGYGLVPLVLSTVGAALMAQRFPTRAMVLFSVPIIYLLFMSTQRLFFVRFAMPVLPFAAVASGYAVDRIGRRLSATNSSTIAWVVVAFAAVQPLFLSVQHDVLIGRSDTRELAAAWIDANVGAEASIAVDSFSLMDGRYGWPTGTTRNTSYYRIRDDEGMAQLLKGGFDYVVVSDYGPEQWQRVAEALGQGPYRRLEEAGQLQARFGPGPGGTNIPYSLDDTYTPFWNLGNRERPGPTIWIYRLGTGSGTISLP